MRKGMKLILSVVLIITMIFVDGILFKNNNEHSISTILSKPSYAYLPKEAKDYIEKVYEETGEIILTEKNKEDNEPYLNPKYVEYLELSDDEKEQIELIPDVYVLDYEVNKNYSTQSLPSSYDLRNIDGKNYISSIKNQESTGICWAFASVENVETLLMKQSGQSYSDRTQTFSIRQMDYATATNRLIKSYVDSGTVSCTPVESCRYYVWENPDNGSRELGKGGNFFTSSIVMANGLTLVDESVLPWNAEDHTYWPKDIFSYEKSLYEVNSTIQMSTINEDSASEELINSYVNDVKNYMIQYGGPFVGTYSPKSTCGFDNIDGTKAMKTDDCVNDASNKNLGHAMQIIGWDDDYEYSYCDAGTKHYAVKNGSCTSGELTQGKGAWILRNSWGVESEEGKAYKYFYLTYDSTRLSIGFTTSISEMANRSWDNNYHSNPWIESNISKGMASVSEQIKEFDMHNNKAEKIEKVKFVTSSKNGKFTLSITTEDKEYKDIAVVNTNEIGVYTIDLSDKNIVLKDNNFSVKMVGENDGKFYNDSISVFTSNVDDAPSVTTYSSKAYDSTKPLSNDNPLYVSGDNYWYLTVNTYLKNIPSNSDLTYRIKKDDGAIATESQIAEFKKIIINDFGEATFSGAYNTWTNNFSTSEAYGKTYTFEVVYNDVVVDSFPIKFSGKGATTKSTIRLHANNGTDYYYSTTNPDNTNVKFNNMSSLQTAEFYNNGYYIVGWNTKADGTGTNYSVDDAIPIYKDTDLYAQWSDDKINSVNFKFNCQQSSYCYEITGTVESQTVEYNQKIIMPDNNYVRTGYKFNGWGISSGGYSMFFYEGQSSYPPSYYIKYPIYNNFTISAYAIWIEEDNAIEISFDSNGGTGNMKPINVRKAFSNGDLIKNQIKENSFTKPGYAFVGWNTAPDGTGISYLDKGTIQSDSDITLYAQWEKVNEYTVTFYPNGGIGTLTPQQVVYNTSTKLSKNTFTRTGYTFKEWNTAEDGTGTSYIDEQSVLLSNDLTLYAIWEEEFDYVINKYDVDEINKYINKIIADTDINDFASSFILGYGYGIDVDTKEINSKAVLYTGGKTRITKDLDLYREYTNIVIGDINGDGAINSADLLKIRQHLLGTNILSDIYFLSSDINDDDIINSADLLRVRQHLLGTKPIE